MALSTNNPMVLYIRVELPRVYGKYRVQYDLIQYIDHPITGEKAQIDRQIMECDYNLDGPNIFEQCYEHAKKELPYATIDC
ncbi:hypothetical protein NB16F77_19020 [Escherichia coli]